MRGTIARLVAEKGYGFIACQTGAQDVFFHRTVVEGAFFEQLFMGQLVEVEVDPFSGTARPRALRVIVETASS